MKASLEICVAAVYRRSAGQLLENTVTAGLAPVGDSPPETLRERWFLRFAVSSLCRRIDPTNPARPD
jgi:hypothetical protein